MRPSRWALVLRAFVTQLLCNSLLRHATGDICIRHSFPEGRTAAPAALGRPVHSSPAIPPQLLPPSGRLWLPCARLSAAVRPCLPGRPRLRHVHLQLGAAGVLPQDGAVPAAQQLPGQGTAKGTQQAAQEAGWTVAAVGFGLACIWGSACRPFHAGAPRASITRLCERHILSAGPRAHLLLGERPGPDHPSVLRHLVHLVAPGKPSLLAVCLCMA